jgi:hypothetical protein
MILHARVLTASDHLALTLLGRTAATGVEELGNAAALPAHELGRGWFCGWSSLPAAHVPRTLVVPHIRAHWTSAHHICSAEVVKAKHLSAGTALLAPKLTAAAHKAATGRPKLTTTALTAHKGSELTAHWTAHWTALLTKHPATHAGAHSAHHAGNAATGHAVAATHLSAHLGTARSALSCSAAHISMSPKI